MCDREAPNKPQEATGRQAGRASAAETLGARLMPSPVPEAAHAPESRVRRLFRVLIIFAAAFLVVGGAALFTDLVLLEAADPQWVDTPGVAADMVLCVARWTVLATVAFSVTFLASGGLRHSRMLGSAASILGAACGAVAAFGPHIARAPLGWIPLFPVLAGFLLARCQRVRSVGVTMAPE